MHLLFTFKYLQLSFQPLLINIYSHLKIEYRILLYSILRVPLINYSGSPARWLSSTGNYGGEWFFVSHDGSTLREIDTKGLWLGYTSKAGETTILHYVVVTK